MQTIWINFSYTFISQTLSICIHFKILSVAISELPQKDWEKIVPHLERLELGRGTLILEEGKICRHLYFLESGFLRFFVWRSGIASTKFFTQAPYCFTSQRSFNMDTPANESIEVIEDCVIWKMKKEDAFQLLNLPSWNKFVRVLIQEVQFNTEQILEDIQNETAEHRYRKMLTTGNPILQKAPLKHLASYLGIAPQSLSRIRKKVLKQI